jgi:hypothetical protein
MSGAVATEARASLAAPGAASQGHPVSAGPRPANPAVRSLVDTSIHDGQLRQWIDQVTVSNVNGRRAITTTNGDAQGHTKTWRYSDGSTSWNSWTETWFTDQITDDGAVIDPTRVSQQFTTGQAAGTGTISADNPAASATQGGICGLTGSIESCLTPNPTLLYGCAGLTGCYLSGDR